MIECLGKSVDGKMSSQPVFKTGRNRGRRRRERGGEWIYASGYCCDSSMFVPAAHAEWIRAVVSLGCRVGHHDKDGVRNYYVFRADGIEKEG
jgi:hypothetical protein